MPVAVSMVQASNRFPVEGLRLLQVALILGDNRQIIELHGDTRMIVAEHPSIDVQGALIGLPRKRPLALARVNAREIVQQRGNIRRLRAGRLQNVETVHVEILGLA